MGPPVVKKPATDLMAGLAEYGALVRRSWSCDGRHEHQRQDQKDTTGETRESPGHCPILHTIVTAAWSPTDLALVHKQ